MSVSAVSDSSRQVRVEEDRRRAAREAERSEKQEREETRPPDRDKGNRVNVKA